MKKLALIATICIMLALLSMPLTALAAGGQSITRTFAPTAQAAEADGDGDGFGTNPTYAYDDGGLGSAVDTDSGDLDNTTPGATGADKHRYYNYGMDTIPLGSTIAGITVRADIAVDNTAHSPWTAIQLSWDSGTSWTTAKQTTLTGTAETTYTYGGPADDWGHTPWSASEVTDANFRVRVIDGDTHATQNARDFSLDYIPVSITFTAPWDSYQDTARGTGQDTFTGGTNIVYMEGTGFLDSGQNYNVGYYDSGGTLIATDNNIALYNPGAGRGTLGDPNTPFEPMYDLTGDLGAAPSPPVWNAVAQPSGATAFPPNYGTLTAAPDTYELIANDTFTVDASAIPEFPTIMAAIGVVGLCFGIYYWMRKRVRRVRGVC